MSEITLSRALKIKNRLAGEIAGLQGRIAASNSRLTTEKSKEDMDTLLIKYHTTLDKLISLKTSINKSTAPISALLIELAETKGMISFYSSLSTKEGIFEESVSYGKDPIKREYEVYLNKLRIQDDITTFQSRINQLQDEIDEYNAITKINFEE